MTIGDTLKTTAATLARAGIGNSVNEAAWLLEHVAGLDRTALMAGQTMLLTRAKAARLARLVARRCRLYPLQYLIGSVPFASVNLAVTPAVLIPRPETEELVELALSLMAIRRGASNKSTPSSSSAKSGTCRLQCADLGTGSGCIAIALAHALPASRWHACDLSAAALRIARKNAAANRVARRVAFCKGSWFAALPAGFRYDLITANPPYVETGSNLGPELAHEPQEALYAGHEGLDAYREILAGLTSRLKPGGWFVGEMGLGQGSALKALARRHGFTHATCRNDMTGRERFLIVTNNR